MGVEDAQGGGGRRHAARRRWPTRRGVVAAARDLSRRSFGPATAKYRELGTVANLLTFNRLARPADAQLPAGHVRGRRGAVRRGAERGPARGPRSRARPAPSAASTSTPRADGDGVRLEYETPVRPGPAVRHRRPRRRAAGGPAVRPAWASTRSPPARPSPSRWSAPRRGLLDEPGLRFGNAAAHARRCWSASPRAKGWATCWPRGRGGRRRAIGGDGAGLRPARQGAGMPGYEPRALANDGAGLRGRQPRRRPQPLRRLRGRLLAAGRPAARHAGGGRGWRSRPRTAPR